MEENKGPMKQIAKNMIKKKIWAFIAPAIPPVLLFLVVALLVIGAAFIFLYPVIKGGQLVEGVVGFWDHVSNGIALKCLFCSSDDLNAKKEKQFYDKVEKINQTYLKNMRIQLDIPLLLSAMFYTEDIEQIVTNDSEEQDYNGATSGDLLGDVSWYYDQGDQERIEWYVGDTYDEGCRILGYHYYNNEEVTLGKKSKLRRMAKHMVKRVMAGACIPIYDEKTGEFIKWQPQEWPQYVLDIDRTDTLYTLEYDQEPYKNYRSVDEISSLPPTFITYLIANYFPSQYPNYFHNMVKDLSDDHKEFLDKRKNMKNIIYSLKGGYDYLTGKDYGYVGGGPSCSINNSNCSYNVKSADNKNIAITNAKVKLLKCNGTESNEALVDFEKYILGVLYASNTSTPLEALKAEAIAVRGYTLKNGENSHDKNLKIYQKNRQWIIPMINCSINEQFYCDPEKGCTKDGNEIYSGTVEGKVQFKKALPSNSELRNAVSDTGGKVLVDGENILYTKYNSADKNKWSTSASKGEDAYQALAQTFGSNFRLIANNCSGCVTTIIGDFLSWRQKGESWSNLPLGSNGYTIGQIGCLATSVAKVIAMSGTKVTIDNFNPGTMVTYLNKHGGFSGSNWLWNSPQQTGLTPNFIHRGSVNLQGKSRQEKALKAKEYLSRGYYLILQVGVGDYQHWVAAIGATNNDIIMSDTETNKEKVWDVYKPEYTVQFHYYEKMD